MRRRGQALIELALCAVLLGGLLAGAVEYGLSMQAYGGLLDALRQGARLAMRDDAPCGVLLDHAIRQSVARAGSGLGLRESQVEVTRDRGTVRIAIRGYSATALFGPRRFDGSPSLTLPAVEECGP